MNLGYCLKYAYDLLKLENIDSYMLDVQLLMCKVLNKDKMYLIMNRDYKLTEKEKNEFFKLVELRKQRMPIKYILEQCEFMGIPFYVREGVLIPRPDTEILVEWALNLIEKEKITKVCDLCCGSGAIGLTVAKNNEQCKVELYDISRDALEVTEENIKRLQLKNAQVKYSDLLERPIRETKKFELLLSNPPYIAKEEVNKLMKDVKDFEPFIALCGGEDGLDFYRSIIKQSKLVLEKRAYIGFEIGYDQGESVSKLLGEEGFNKIEVLKDFSGLDRVVIGQNQ